MQDLNPRPAETDASTLSQDTLIAATDQCVKCGLCLPHCPTYRLTRDEAESPRGRIALVQALVSGALPPSRRLDAHLASCLECRACEPVCPSLVAVGAIMDQARALQSANQPGWRRGLRRAALRALSSPAVLRLAQRLAVAYRMTGLDAAAERLGIRRLPRLNAYARLAHGLQPPPRRHPDEHTAGDVSLFFGCASPVTQSAALEATRLVLQHLGIGVLEPRGQGCCGAMLRHNGFPTEADAMLERNAAALAEAPPLGVASACVAELRAHPRLGQTQEVCTFLAQAPWPEHLCLRAWPVDVLVHEPCSHRNQLGGNADVYRLLARIPGLRATPLPDNAFCCGAAGTYFLHHPHSAQALLRDKIAHLARMMPQVLVTTNPGCALHLAAGLREAGLAIEVCHPVELIARRLPSP